MIDTQRLGALLRQWLREDALTERLRTTPAVAVRALAAIGPDRPGIAPDATHVSLSAAAVAALVQRPDGEHGAAVPGAAEDLATASQPGTRGDAPAARSATGGAAALASASTAAAADARSPPTPRSASLVLSATGLMLLDALRADDAADAAGRPRLAGDGADITGSAARTAVPAKALVAVPPHSEYATDRLALQLKDAVEFSGVFYESHLAQWADDRRPRALLAREPQSAWPATTPAPEAGRASDLPGVARPLVREQLAVLDSGRFVWQGELWPGQRAMMSIEEDAHGADDGSGERPAADPAAPRWRMRLTLQFADLGVVDAQLRMSGDAVDIALGCDDGAATARLRDAAPALHAAIASRALALNSLVVTDESAE